MTTLELGPGQRSEHDDPVEPCTGTFDALGHRFAVATEDLRVVALVESAFSVLAAGGKPTGWYRARRHAEAVELRWEEELVGTATDAADLLSLLRAHVQKSAIAAAEDDLVLRAGCVEHDGRVVLVSGARRGVSTLVAALVAEGCTDLGDGAIPVELRSGRVRPFLPPVPLDDRALDLLPEVSPLRSGRDSVGAPEANHASRDVAFVVFPERDDSRIAMLHGLDRDDTIVRLVEHSYNFPGREQQAIEAVHWLVRGADAYVVTGGDPRGAARAVLDDLVTETDPGSSRSGPRMCPVLLGMQE
jgi:hypothetical protein